MFGTVGSRAGKSAASLLRSKAAAKVALNDTSARIGNASRFWNPTYFGNPAVGEVHRLNRLLIGEAALGSSDNPMTKPDWLEAAAVGTTSAGQISSVSTIGGVGVVGASKTSDYRSWAGGAAGGSEGVLGIGWNDDATAATTPIAVGGEFRGWRKTGVVGLTMGAQISASNNGSTVDITPQSGMVSGATVANLLTAGPGPTGYTNPISAIMVMGSGDGTAIARKGIVSLNGALDASLGAGGHGIFADLYTGQSLRWLNSSDAVVAEIWGAGTGLNVNSGLVALGTADFFNAFTAQETRTGSNNGPYFIASRINSAPGVSDGLGVFIFQGTNSTPSQANVAGFSSRWAGSVTAGAESGALDIQTVQAGTYGNRVSIGAGIQIGAPSGGDKGAGSINVSGNYYNAGNQVVSTRKTGWTAATGTATRTSFATGSVTLPNLAQAVKALIDDLISHGLIGT